MSTSGWNFRGTAAGTALLVLYCGAIAEPGTGDLADVGQALFFDTNLSVNRTQACASCHNPATAFVDSRDNGVGGAVSRGDDGVSLGDRNAPTLTYASLIPEFSRTEDGQYEGGKFYDGRAANLSEQAEEPFTNPIEMALPDNESVIDRVRENPRHVDALKKHFGESVFETTESAIQAITRSIAAFERTTQFAPFDSKYDRYLRGEYQLTDKEEVGRVLFFSQLFNCHSCHLIDTREFQHGEVFTNHRYHNIGVPINTAVRAKNGLVTTHRDLGLLENPAVEDPALAGKFKVPTLRNVAVTGPYMHNGVFQDLSTVIVFYNKFMLGNAESQTNPETGKPWEEPEVPDTVDLDLLREGQPISAVQVEALEAFLAALTDQRYESLLNR